MSSPLSASQSSPPNGPQTGFVRGLFAHERELWLAALLLYGLGDGATTLVGMELAGVAEVGALAAPAIDRFGPLGLVGLKLLLFAVAALLWRVLRTPGRVAVPVALAGVGGVVTTWNLLVITGVF